MYEEMDQRLGTVANEAAWKAATDVTDRNSAERIGARKALAAFQAAEHLSPDYCFPNRLEDLLALQAARRLNPGGSVLLHVFESESAALSDVLPSSADVRVLDHPVLRPHGTVGMLIGFPR